MIRIGSDETLKGDTFGGIVVVGVQADDDVRKKLEALGIKDSKRHNHNMIHKHAQSIREIAKFSVCNLYPEEYNKAESVTALLNRLHKEVAEELGEGTHIVDAYPGCTTGDIIETKAEDKYIEVAAASIIARDEAMHQMAKLEEKAGFKIPLGSTHVKEALEKVKEKKLDPKQFVKIGFKNVKAALGL